ncbi:MAG TPA: squalene/phytoene synthase family protein, partial [Rhizomicrobium sp.]|nr:squalene/phytoene synthase family protein [Rhizomicrobium sp.]
LRTLPHQNARRKLFLPTDVLAQRGISADDVLSGKADRQGLREAMASVAEAARLHHASARARSIPKEALPALLPAALVPVYLKKLAKPDLDPLRDLIEVPAWRKQLAYLRAAVVGRI